MSLNNDYTGWSFIQLPISSFGYHDLHLKSTTAMKIVHPNTFREYIPTPIIPAGWLPVTCSPAWWFAQIVAA